MIVATTFAEKEMAASVHRTRKARSIAMMRRCAVVSFLTMGEAVSLMTGRIALMTRSFLIHMNLTRTVVWKRCTPTTKTDEIETRR